MLNVSQCGGQCIWHHHRVVVPCGKARKCSLPVMAAWAFLICEEKALSCWSTGRDREKNTSHPQTPPWNTGPRSIAVWTIQRDSRPQEQHGTQSHCPQQTTLTQLLPSRPDIPEVSAEASQGLLLRGHQQILCPGDSGTPWSRQMPSTAVRQFHCVHTPSRHTWATP